MLLKIGKTEGYNTGGKAQGLSELIKLGMNVPDGYVLLGALDEQLHKELHKMLHDVLDIPMAIRSSAIEEDGEKTSFAGQFETFLNCKGMDQIVSAIEQSRSSAQNIRVSSYASHFNKQTETLIPVVIQRMVNAKRSGVLFTANPVNQRRDQYLISVTYGLGEKLVSGIDTGEQYLLSHKGTVIQKGSLLQTEQINDLFNQAKKIHKHFNEPVDLEWAIDENNNLFWLQVRPITTLKETHLNELDGILYQEDEIFTRGNIGEMMPGPVTPLTYSVFGRAIEIGLQDFYIRCGAQKEFSDEWLYFRMFYNHLFFSMSGMYSITENVLLNKKESVEFSIMGESLNNNVVISKAPLYKRVYNQFKQFRYLSSGIKRMHLLEKINARFHLDLSLGKEELYQKLSASLDILNEAYSHHYCTSSQSGSYNSALMQILGSGNTKPSIKDHQNASALMANIEGIEGADLVHALEVLVNEFTQDEDAKNWILGLDDQSFEALIHHQSAPENAIQEKFHDAMSGFLETHGHRCIREAELREKSWSEDPVQLLDIVQKLLSNGTGKRKRQNHRENKRKIYQSLKPVQRLTLNYVLTRARAAVARREYTKSLCIKIQYRIKQAYLKLADLLVAEGFLDTIDQIFFLTHKELGSYLESGDQVWKKKASDRQEVLQDSFKLRFPDVSTGIPEPIEGHVEPPKINGNALSGIPVSAGTVTGQVKVIRDKKDAERLQQGDIMVCQYTDIGWTPFFSVISGLVTEIGSPLSHGAVVAREYGIPAVVNVKGAMHFFESEEMVILDGKQGVVKKLSV